MIKDLVKRIPIVGSMARSARRMLRPDRGQDFDSADYWEQRYRSGGNSGAEHVKHRRFADWVARHRPDFRLIEHEANPYPEDPGDPQNTSFADFHVFEKAEA